VATPARKTTEIKKKERKQFKVRTPSPAIDLYSISQSNKNALVYTKTVLSNTHTHTEWKHGHRGGPLIYCDSKYDSNENRILAVFMSFFI